MIATLSHVNIRVANPVPSVEFYRAVGLDVVGSAVLSAGYYLIYLGSPVRDDITVELVINESAGEDYDRSPGAGHIGLVVEDLDAALARLEEIGIRPETPPAHPAGREDLPRIAFVRDPDEVRVELIDRLFPTPQDKLDDSVRAALSLP